MHNGKKVALESMGGKASKSLGQMLKVMALPERVSCRGPSSNETNQFKQNNVIHATLQKTIFLFGFLLCVIYVKNAARRRALVYENRA
jgi:flagellar biosynthesis/type III secretory pathway M-ring protein FliF/YscJ